MTSCDEALRAPPRLRGEAVSRARSNQGATGSEVSWPPLIVCARWRTTGAEPIGSMGTDTPLAVLSDRPRLLFDYFTQLFAQVTNPPLDAIREELVTSLQPHGRPRGQPARARGRRPAGSWCCRSRSSTTRSSPRSSTSTTRVTCPASPPMWSPGSSDVNAGGEALAARLAEIRAEVSAAIDGGARIIILSDRGAPAPNCAPIPSLLLTGAVHHHLIREKTRTRVGLVVETGDAREVHHIALLIGYGAAAVNPYLAIETVEDLAAGGVLRHRARRRPPRNLVKALGKGVLQDHVQDGRVHRRLLHRRADLRGDRARRRGDRRLLHRHHLAARRRRLRRARRGGRSAGTSGRTRRTACAPRTASLAVGGEYQWRREGEPHLFNPQTVFKLQHSTRTAAATSVFKEYTRLVDEQSRAADDPARAVPAHARACARRCRSTRSSRSRSIVKRFATGAMSYGSISAGGARDAGHRDEPDRRQVQHRRGRRGRRPLRRDANGDLRRSAIKQVASGRFGVTSEYLVNADDLQIKMAQGAKPGEGGQLPGHKVYPWIAKTRHSTPGVGLISPPPHHDIYSIEDLAQLIHDLKNANPRGARARQAGLRGRGRHGRRRGGQGPRRRRAHLRPRRRHRRVAAVLDQARRHAVGARAWPRPSRRCCSTSCGTGSSCRPTAS